MNRLLPLALLLLLATPALGHGAPDPADRDTRVLHDHNDDCGGDNPVSGPTGGNCGGTHDLIALDVREAWESEHTLVFTLYMAEGASGTLEDTITFKAGGKTHALEMSTRNDNSFTSSDCDVLGRETFEAANKRFTLACQVAVSDLGLSIGDRLTNFRVEATRDGDAGDHMPGAYDGALSEDPPQGNDPTNYVRSFMELNGPTQYATLKLEESAVQLDVDEEQLIVLAIDNQLDDQAQSFTFRVSGANGVTARFHDPSAGDGQGYSNTYTLDLNKRQSSFVHVAIRGDDADATGTLRIEATSDAGARNEATLRYGVGAAPPPPTTTTPPETDEESPGLGFVVLVGALLFASRLRRP